MRFPQPRPRNDDQRILPLINVVFLLLIFFMLAGKLAASDPFEILPPQSASEGGTAPQEVIVAVGADGRLAVDGVVMAEDAVADAISSRLSDEPDVRFQLRADGRTDATSVVAVMELMREAGVERLELLTVPEPQ